MESWRGHNLFSRITKVSETNPYQIRFFTLRRIPIPEAVL
jgi:hypothetical protein